MAKVKLPPTRKELAKMCKEKRKRLGLSCRSAATVLGVSPSTYCRIEDARPMTLETYHTAYRWVNEI